MSDRSYLDWPFLNDDHRALAAEVDTWAEDHLVQLTQHEEEDLDGTCKAIVRALGKAGLLRHAVPQSAGGVNPKLDVRSLSVIRETLGRYHTLADFAFAMQGLGGGGFAAVRRASGSSPHQHWRAEGGSQMRASGRPAPSFLKASGWTRLDGCAWYPCKGTPCIAILE